MDSSALVKKYVNEPESDVARRYISSTTELITARHSTIEVRSTLSRVLKGKALMRARDALAHDLAAFDFVELDRELCAAAVAIVDETPVGTLDALHIAAALRIKEPELSFLTFDKRQTETARNLGLTVVGA